METRVAGSCQTWKLISSGGAGYRVTNVATGSVLTDRACQSGGRRDGLRVRPVHRAPRACSTWTLVPANDGTWSLATADSSHRVRLLLP